ncbi:hypothetical protein BD310DRAFT_782769, partial [Dichomitus squalens]
SRNLVKKAKHAAVPGGLRSDWQDWYKTPAKTSRPQLRISTASKSSRHTTLPVPRRRSRPTTSPSPDLDDQPAGMRDYGGLGDEDETHERDALDRDVPLSPLEWGDDEDEDLDEREQRDTTMAVAVRRRDIYTAVRRVTPSEAALSETKKKAERNRVNGNDIPREYAKEFNERLVPFLRAAVGTMTPFTPFELHHKRQIFKKIFVWSDVTLEPDSVFVKVMENRFSDWKTKFREAALTVVRDEMMHPERKSSREARIAFVREQLALTPGADRADKDTIKNMRAPFFWAEWDKGRKSGRFEGPMLLKTFAYAHLPVLQAVPDDIRDSVGDIFGKLEPVGALVMAALAVEFALHAWLTGNHQMARGAEGLFSADNWGDKVVQQNGVAVQENKVTCLFARASDLSDERLLRILDSARELIDERRQRIVKGKAIKKVQEDTAPDFASSD